MMYNHQHHQHHQQQYAGIAPQGGFNPGANPQMMQGMSAGMMQSSGMPNMAANGQSEWLPPRSPASRDSCLPCAAFPSTAEEELGRFCPPLVIITRPLNRCQGGQSTDQLPLQCLAIHSSIPGAPTAR